MSFHLSCWNCKSQNPTYFRYKQGLTLQWRLVCALRPDSIRSTAHALRKRNFKDVRSNHSCTFKQSLHPVTTTFWSFVALSFCLLTKMKPINGVEKVWKKARFKREKFEETSCIQILLEWVCSVCVTHSDSQLYAKYQKLEKIDLKNNFFIF